MISARPLETRYDSSRDGQLTVSTPSCCCCCCCCLGTVAGVLTFSVRQVGNEADTAGGNSLGAALSFFSFPIGVAVMIGLLALFDGSMPWLIIGVSALVAIAVYAIGHLLANKDNTIKAFVVPTLLVLTAGVAMVAEVFAVLLTVGIGWIVIVPLLAWGSYKIADAVSPPAKREAVWTQPPVMGLGVGPEVGAPQAPGVVQSPGPVQPGVQPTPTYPPPGGTSLPQAPLPPPGTLPGDGPAPPTQDQQAPPPSIPDERLPPDFPRT